MRRLIFFILLMTSAAFANESAQGPCAIGGQVVVTAGMNSTTKALQSFPLCTVTVTIHGGGIATIYSDNSNTPLANPFTATSQGYWQFYAANGHYDVNISGAGITSPFTFSDIILLDLNYAIFYADGVNYTTIQAAITAAGTSGTVVIQSNYPNSDSYTNPNNIPITDLRQKAGAWRDFCSVKDDYGAKGDGTTDDTEKFIAAGAACKYIVVPYTSAGYNVDTGSIPIVSGQTWKFFNATIKHTTTSIMFSAVNQDDWAVIGPVTLQGLNGGTVAGAGTAETLLYVAGGHRWKVDKVYGKFSNGWGFKHDPGTFVSPRGTQGHVSDSDFSTNYYGVEDTPGSGAEYTVMTSVSGSNNTFGLTIEAGNTQCVGCNFSDNSTNLSLLSGTNHGHGEIIGGNYNHATVDNLLCTSVTNGMTIVGAHFYANDGISGFIHLNGCNGIVIADGFIDSVIKNDAANGSNNFINGNYMVTAIGQTTPTGTSGQTNLSMVHNITPTGFWGINNGFVEANGSIAAGPKPGLSFTAGDVGASRTTTTGALYLGNDGLGYIYRSTNQLQIGQVGSLVTALDLQATLGDGTHRWTNLFTQSLVLNGGSAISGQSGTGSTLAMTNTPILVTPVLGAATGTSLNLGATGTLSTTAQSGTGSLAMTNSPVFVTPALGAATATSLTINSGTTIAKYYAVSAAITPAATAANTCAEQSFTPAGFSGVINAGDNIFLTTSATMAANGVFPVMGIRAIANGVDITYCNTTAGGLTAPAVTITITGTR